MTVTPIATKLAKTRPMPPDLLREHPDEGAGDTGAFVPAEDVACWLRAAFLVEGSPLRNPDHQHLEHSLLGVLWTNVPNRRQQRGVVGTAELLAPKGNAWQRERQLWQMRDWFGEVPDALITLSAPYCAEASDAQFCALVEHELYHLAQRQGQYGPQFSPETGRPVLAMRGHDAEEFVGVVRRYGARAAGVQALVTAAEQWERDPIVTGDLLEAACGCGARIAA